MDRQSGKMSQKYECLHCGAVFSKRSFLEEHKRILGHRDLFSCDVCHKNFYRKDNLDTHKKKHDKINNICYQHYSEPESLELHHIHTHHGQTGRGQKRKGQENYGPPVKRKLTTFDNPEDMYTIMVVGEHRMPKFNTTSTRYKVTFKDLDIRGIPNILKSLKVLFNSIIRNITEFMDQSDLVRLSVQCPELDFPISLPFMKLSQLHTERLLSEIERVLQSYEQFVLDETLEIELIHVSLPSGGIGKRCKYVDLEKTLNEKRCFLQIQNRDDLCCARAIMRAKARLDGHEKWNSIRQGRNIQGELARKLHNKAGVPFRRCGIEEIKSFQRILDGYQIHVVSKEHFNAIIYEGPTAEKKIYLYLHDHHYDVITAMPAFLSRNYFCTKCNKGYDHKVDHFCNNVCHQCYKTHESGDEDWIYCNDCNRYFKSAKCYEMHKQETSTGKSTCYTNFRCRKCNQSVYTKLHKTAHKCGEHYCKTCKDYVPEEHKCYMLPACPDNIDTLKHDVKPGENAKQLKKKHTKTFIFFDFECTQNKVLQCDMGFEKNIEGRKCKHCKQSWCGTRQHIPNLCIAHKICELCKDSKVDKTSFCDSCGKHEHIFSGESSRDDFCRWLFTEKNAGSKVLCHNFKGYDSYPILQYLYKNAILPEVIVTGSKFMSIDVPQCNIRFIDSINFLPMALDKFPKTFGLKEMVKGYFPHLFNTQENQHTDLPNLPDLKFYNPDGMTRDKRSTFMQWYGEHRYDHFNLQEELLKYCRSDVDILRKGCLEFRKMFMDITTKGDLDGIDPFESCITIASACNLVFRRNFLEHQSIGIIPANGYRCEHKQSIKALKWLKYLSEKDTIDIMHAGNGSEKQIGSFLVDGYRETEAGEREVYEFHGCFWHGCDKCFGRSTINPVTGYTMADLFQRTMDKWSFLEKDGYKYISIWECQFDNELKSNVQMRNFVENLCLKDPLEPRDAFYGGRTEAFTTYKEAKGDKIDYYDVTSLYPFINKTGKIPLGHPKTITENFEDINRYEGLIKCKIVPPRGLFLPVLPLKCNGKLLFGLCHTCMKNNFTDECKHTDEERAIVGTWVTDEIKKAVSKGYLITELYEVWHFDEVSQYNPDTKEGGIFTEYVNTFLKIKQEASGWPEWCLTDQDKHTYIKNYFEKEGIWLEEKNIKENPGLRQLAKLILNSFWGKFGQRLNLPKTTYVKDAATYFDILTSDRQEVKDVSFVSEEMVRLQWINNEKFVEESGKTNVVIAAYTTAQARLQLYKYLENLGDRSLYCDTDSIIFSSKPGDWRPMTGDYLGDLTDELPNNNIEVFVSGGPKNYAFKLIKPDKAGNQTCCKIRGITLNYKNSLELNFEIVKEMVKGRMKSVTVTDEYKIRRNVKSIDIISCVEEKDYRIVFDKRVLKDNYTTVPYGM